MSLRSRLIRLAHNEPSLRSSLLPLLKVAQSWEDDLRDKWGRKLRPTTKDYQRVDGIIAKAVKKYPDDDFMAREWEVQLARNMAKAIRSSDKAYRRYGAAEDENFHDIAAVFYVRARELFQQGR